MRTVGNKVVGGMVRLAVTIFIRGSQERFTAHLTHMPTTRSLPMCRRYRRSGIRTRKRCGPRARLSHMTTCIGEIRVTGRGRVCRRVLPVVTVRYGSGWILWMLRGSTRTLEGRIMIAWMSCNLGKRVDDMRRSSIIAVSRCRMVGW
jgi:hypothetical protein